MFAEKEVHHNGSQKVASREHVSIPIVDHSSDEGSEKRNQEIPQPIAACRQTNGLSPVPSREHFANNRPDDRTPSLCVANDEEASEDDHCGACAGSVGGLGLVEGEVTDGREHHKADELPKSTTDECTAATEVLNYIESGESHAGDDES